MRRPSPAHLVLVLIAAPSLLGPALGAPGEEFVQARRAELAAAEALFSLSENAPAARVAELRTKLEEARSRTREVGAATGTGAPVQPLELTELPVDGEAATSAVVPVVVAALGIVLLVWIARRRSDSRRRAPRNRSTETEPSSSPDGDRRRILRGIVGAVVGAVVVFGLLVWTGAASGLGVGASFGVSTALIVTVAFLAREAIGDVVKGAALLLERPFEENDVVRIGEVEGVVERIGARCTVIRDFHGGIHHVPNGGIHALSNFTRAWSRASAHVRVAYAEDIDRVIEALREAVVDVRADPAVGGLVADDQEVIGIDRYEDGGAVLRVSLKTRPLREALVEETIERRITHRLGALEVATDLCPRRGRSDAPCVD